MAQSNKFFKQNEDDSIWWVDDPEKIGSFLFTFDKKTIFNLFSDYPDKLTEKQKAVFDEENPEWAKFFADRG